MDQKLSKRAEIWALTLENYGIPSITMENYGKTMEDEDLASGKLTVCFGKSPSLIGKPTLNHLFSAIFHSYVCLPEGTMKNIDG